MSNKNGVHKAFQSAAAINISMFMEKDTSAALEGLRREANPVEVEFAPRTF